MAGKVVRTIEINLSDNASAKLTAVQRRLLAISRVGNGSVASFAASSKSLRVVSTNASQASQAVSKIGKSATNATSATQQLANVANEAKENLDKAAKSAFQINPKTPKVEANGKGAGMGSGAAQIAAAVGAASLAKGAFDLSDTMNNNLAKLQAFTGSLEQARVAQQKIFLAAQASRTDYQELQTTVAKLGTLAKNAFKNPEETIRFAELLGKKFQLAGADAASVTGATRQLVQALGSGVLRGDELNSVFEAAPNLIQDIADYMNVPIGQIRQLAGEGKLTADIVKNAILSSGAAADAAFGSMPVTFSQAMTKIKNTLQLALQPFLEGLGKIAGFMAENSSWIAPLITGLTAAAIAIGGISAAMSVFNMICAANPLILIIGAVIAAVVALISYLGGLSAAWEYVKASATWLWITIQQGIQGVLMMIGLLYYKVLYFGTMIKNAVILGVLTLKAGVLSVIEALVNGAIDLINLFISALNKIPGVSIAAIEHVSFAASAKAQVEAHKQSSAKDLEDITAKQNAFLAGKMDKMSALSASKDGLFDKANAQRNMSKGTSATPATAQAVSADQLGTLPGDVGQTAKNTGKMANSMEDSEEEIKYLRDIAEQEAINKYTTASISVNMGGVSNIVNHGGDLDSFANEFASKLYGASQLVANGGYA